MEKVNVLSGEIQRTWVWQGKDGRKFHIDLHHDTLTGVRSLALDLDEVPGSMGTTPPFFAGDAHHIQFTIGPDKARGMVIIEKAGLLSFRYSCVVNGRPLKATMAGLADENEERFRVRIPATAVAYSTKEASVTWYELCVERQSDGARTIVHRRYREFQNLLEQVHAAFKGHHLRSSIPELPGRQLKLLVDHNDQAFVEERRLLLENAMGKLLSVPHVSSMVPVQVFLGFFDRLKEHSVVFSQRDLGLSITRTRQNVPGAEEAILVTRVRVVQGGLRTRVMVGDTVSKVNGEPISKFGFDGVTQTISRGLRPVVLHFLQAVEKNPLHDFVDPGEEIVVSEVDAPMVMDRGAGEPQQQQHARRPSQQLLPPAPLPSKGPAPRPSAAAAVGSARESVEEDDGVERLDKEPAPGIDRIQRRDPKAQLHSLLEAALAEEEKKAPPASSAAGGGGAAAGTAGQQPQQAGRLSPMAAATAVAGPLPVSRAKLDPLLFGREEEKKKPEPPVAMPAPAPAPAPVEPEPVEEAKAPEPVAATAPVPAPAEEKEEAAEPAAPEAAEPPVVAPVPAVEAEAEEEKAPEKQPVEAAAPEQAGKEEEQPAAANEKEEEQEEQGEPEEAAPVVVVAPEPEATEPEKAKDEAQPEPEPEPEPEQPDEPPAPSAEAPVEVAAPAPVAAVAASASHAEQPAGFLRSVSPLAPVEPVEPAVKEVITTATTLPPTEDNPFWHSDDAEPDPPATEAPKRGGNGGGGGAVEEKEKEAAAAAAAVVHPPQPWQTESALDFSHAAPHHYKPMLGTASPPRAAAVNKAGEGGAKPASSGSNQAPPPPSPYEVDL